MSASSDSGYANFEQVKKRLNQDLSVVAPDKKIHDMMQEADNYVNTQINLHALTPIDTPDPEIISLSTSLAATIYNYWQTPIKDRNLDPIKFWKQSIQDHILATYGRKNPNLLAAGDSFGTTTGFKGTT